MRRLLVVGAVIAGGVHVFSLPWISRLVSSVSGEPAPQVEATPIEIIVEEEVVQQTPDLEPEPPKENPEPAASAERPSAPPLATTTEPVPISEVASADTVAVAPAIATESGVEGGEGAVGDSSVIGLVAGSGEPTESGSVVNLPDVAAFLPEPEEKPRTPVQALAARPSSPSSFVSCNPCSSPEYSTTARREGFEGKPVIEVVYGADGRVTEASVAVSSGNPAFDRAALEEARANWRLNDSRGTGGRVRVDVVYVLDGSEQYEEAQQAGEVLTVPTRQSRQNTQALPPTSGAPPASAPTAPSSPGSNENNSPASSGPANTNPPEPPPPTPSSEAVSEPQEPASPAPSPPPSPAIPDIAPDPVSPPVAAPPPAQEAPVAPPPAPVQPAPVPDIMPSSTPE